MVKAPATCVDIGFSLASIVSLWVCIYPVSVGVLSCQLCLQVCSISICRTVHVIITFVSLLDLVAFV